MIKYCIPPASENNPVKIYAKFPLMGAPEEFENRYTEMEDDARQIEEAAELDLMSNEDY